MLEAGIALLLASMLRKLLFWLHLAIGVLAGLFIFLMASTGVVLTLEKPMTGFIERDLRTVPVPNDARKQPIGKLLNVVRRAELGNPTAITATNRPGATVQFSIGRNKTVYVDPYSGAVLGINSAAAHNFFFTVERLHRSLGAPLGSKSLGHWLAAVSNLLFGVLVLLGVILWIPRRWNWNTLRLAIAFRGGLKARARNWNWHNVIGIWCALPLLIIVLTGVVMSFEWANTLLFRLSGSPPPAARREGAPREGFSGRAQRHPPQSGEEPNYDNLFTVAAAFKPDWRTISLNLVDRPADPVSVSIDTGTGGQPQKRSQYLLDRNTAALLKSTSFSNGTLGQRLRAFVRFGHTGEFGGFVGQIIATLASLGACFLVYTGFALAIGRLRASLRRREFRESATNSGSQLSPHQRQAPISAHLLSREP